MQCTAAEKVCPAGAQGSEPGPVMPRVLRADCTDLTSLPLSGFMPCLTLSSKFFSTFPHSTCLLSVSCRYLALDGVYHQLWAAFTNNLTPPHTVHGLSLYQKDLGPHSTPGRQPSPVHHISRAHHGRGFSAGLFPLCSPLLGESLLVYFPPLSNMLKFSGSSRLI